MAVFQSVDRGSTPLRGAAKTKKGALGGMRVLGTRGRRFESCLFDFVSQRGSDTFFEAKNQSDPELR